MSGGEKKDGGKRPWHLFPWDAAGLIVDVLAFGAQKYAERNWEKGLSYSRVFAASQRHVIAWWEGEDLDRETQLPHLAHAACEILFLLAFAARGRSDLDDRPGREASPAEEAPPPTNLRDWLHCNVRIVGPTLGGSTVAVGRHGVVESCDTSDSTLYVVVDGLRPPAYIAWYPVESLRLSEGGS